MLNAVIHWVVRAATVGGAFGLLILVHEFGHFVVAKMAGVRVLKFSIGFGPTMLRFSLGETEYVIACLPLGGFVKMAGEQQEAATPQPGDYVAKPIWVRSLIVLAGPFVNYISAVLLLWVFLMRGYPGLLPVVGTVAPAMPAISAGIQAGDQVVGVNGKNVRTWDEMTAVIHRSPGQPVELDIERADTRLHVSVTPKAEQVEVRKGVMESIGLIGIGAGARSLSAIEALGISFNMQGYWAKQTMQALGALVTGKRKIKDSMTGPLGIMYLTSEAVSMGLAPLLLLLSLFSLSLAIFNCFPMPILDGGHLLFLFLEKVRGRPVSIVVQERAAMVGLVLLVSLALVVSVNDLNRFWLNR